MGLGSANKKKHLLAILGEKCDFTLVFLVSFGEIRQMFENVCLQRGAFNLIDQL